MAGRYLEQFERTKRWYERFKTINEGREHVMPSDNYQDEAYAFFQNCYHLKDWIKNDKSIAVPPDKVEEVVHQSIPLSICGDIANGSKHLELARPKVDKDAAFGAKRIHLKLGPGMPTTISTKYEILAGGKTYDAFDLGTKCLDAWTQFLKQNGLI